MAANHNGESNGGFRVRWKTLPVIVAMIVAISTGIGGYALSSADSATKIEMRCTAMEKKNKEQDEILKDTSKTIGELNISVGRLNVILERLEKELDKRHP